MIDDHQQQIESMIHASQYGLVHNFVPRLYGLAHYSRGRGSSNGYRQLEAKPKWKADCKYFSGNHYLPCAVNTSCDGCQHFQPRVNET